MTDKIYTRVLVFLMGSFTIWGVLNSLFATTEYKIHGAGFIALAFIIGCSIFFFKTRQLFSYMPLLIKIILLFGIYVICSAAFKAADIREFAYSVRGNLQWIFSLILGFIISYQDNNENKSFIIKGFVIMTLPISLIVVLIKSGIIQSSHVVLDISFMLITLLPFVFRVKNITIKSILVSVIGIISILSFKRSTMLACFAMVLVYYFFEIFFSKKRISFLSSFVTVCIVLCVSYLFLERLSGGFVSERIGGLGNLSTDMTSQHRLVIFENVWNTAIISNPVDFFFGHGYCASFRETGFFAHNDLLEVLLDYGFIGFLIYLAFLILLTKYLIGFYKFQNLIGNESSIFFVTYIAYCFLGMANCFIVSPLYFTIFTFSLGLSIGCLEKMKDKNNLIEKTKKNKNN